jgi:hypothetical protein
MTEVRNPHDEGFKNKKLKRIFEYKRRGVAGWRTLRTEN